MDWMSFLRETTVCVLSSEFASFECQQPLMRLVSSYGHAIVVSDYMLLFAKLAKPSA